MGRQARTGRREADPAANRTCFRTGAVDVVPTSAPARSATCGSETVEAFDRATHQKIASERSWRRCVGGLADSPADPRGPTTEHVMLGPLVLAFSLGDSSLRCMSSLTSPALHDDTPTSKRIAFYDLRATGITWLALDGVQPMAIMHRAGHSSVDTTVG